MRAYVLSIGEKTTKICCEQMERFGYDVIFLDQKESMIDKYKRFIKEANGNCIKIDADIIPNEEIYQIRAFYEDADFKMVQFGYYDLYKNNIGVGNPIYYGKEIINKLKGSLDKISNDRPETSAWRLPWIIDYTETRQDIICGIHGFFQSEKDRKRAEQNKKDRRQIQNFDFDLVNKLYNL